MIDPRELDLNLLVVFQEVYDARQISGAARRLQLTQSSVSNALARLRRSLGDELFVRTAGGMQPTPFAESLAGPIAAALLSVTQALNRPARFDPANSSRQFTLALTDVGELHFMPPLIECCRVHAPGVRLASVRPGTLDLKAEMEAGRIDLAIGAFDNVSGALYQRRLFRQFYVTMFRAGHAFGAGAPTLAQFLAATHLLVASQDSPYDRINLKLEQAGVRAQTRYQVPHFTAVPYIIGSTDLVVTVPQKLAERAAGPFNLGYVRPPLRLPTLQTNVFWHRRFHQDEGSQWLRTLIADTFSEL